MDSNDIVISGLAELQAQLDQFAPQLEAKVLRGALKAGQMVAASKIRDKAPEAPPNDVNARLYGAKFGSLKASVRVSTRARNGKVVSKVTVGDKVAYYAHMVEFGTAAHLIMAKKGRALTFGGRDYSFLMHPGAKAHPFVRPVFDVEANQNSEELQAVVTYLRTRIDKEIASLPDEQDTRDEKP
ncbi:HK97-gp10 family putative phage morphogenesis protein [Rhodoferax sp. GW822-FHT02A01]|uniref:HK97-gp10 family putative phage morphogenesis protein n=1 Tax=Rhodoferax sp. GW822-FHT02A01 TaxID=3141537 RepID=UPI00315C5B60